MRTYKLHTRISKKKRKGRCSFIEGIEVGNVGSYITRSFVISEDKCFDSKTKEIMISWACGKKGTKIAQLLVKILSQSIHLYV
jgi:hypothetical protein